MKTKKLLALALSLLTLALVFSGCADKYEGSYRIFALKGPTGVGMAKLMDDKKDNDNYKFTIASAPDEVSANVIKGDFEFAAVPVNLASVLYKKTEGNIQIVNVNTLGVLYLLENGNTINSLSDLEGKKIYATGQGSTPEYMLKALLKEKNINCEIEFKTEHAELAALLASGDVVLGVLPEPNVTTTLTQNKDLRIALDITKEWKEAFGKDPVQGCLIVNKKFAEENKAAVDQFLNEYKNSIEYTTSNIEKAAVLCETYGIIPKAAVAKKAIPNCNICNITGSDMKGILVPMFELLYEYNPASIGGEIPPEDIYYTPGK